MGCRFELPDLPAWDTRPSDLAGARDGRSTDAGPEDVGGADGIDPLAPFGPPQPVHELNSAEEEDDPTLTADMLEIYFNRGDTTIWCSTRSSLSAPWNPPTMVSELNSTDLDTAPRIVSGGTTIFISSNRSHSKASGSYDIYVASRAKRGDSWSTPQPVVELNSSATDYPGAPTSDLLTITLHSNRGGGPGGFDIFDATRPDTSTAWNSPKLVAAVNLSSTDRDPWVNTTATVLYFASDRQGGLGETDLWIATRSSPAATFTAPAPVAAINSTSADQDPWLSPDQTTIYFSSSRSGNTDLYVAKR